MIRKGKELSLLKQAEAERKRRKIEAVKDFDKLSVRKQLEIVLPRAKLCPKQIKFIEAEQRTKYFIGGYKAGKSFVGLCAMIYYSYLNAPVPGLVIHPTKDGVDVTLQPLFELICEKCDIEYSYKNLSTKTIAILKFGANKKKWGKIIFASGDKPKSLKGPNIGPVLLDEPFLMDEEIVKVAVSRMSIPTKRRHLMFSGTFEPKHMKWGMDIARSGAVATKDTLVVIKSTRENEKNLPPSMVKDMEDKYTEAEKKVFIDGIYQNLNLTGVYKFGQKNICGDEIVKKIEKNNFSREVNLILSFDFNINPITATLELQSGNYYVQVEEWEVANSYTEELCGLVIPKLIHDGYLVRQRDERYLTKYINSLIITGDASGRARKTNSSVSDYEIIFRMFSDARIEISRCVPEQNWAVRDRINYINQLLHNGNFLIHKRCVKSISDRELVQWKAGADGFVIDKSKKDVTHLSDAGDYGVCNTRHLSEIVSSSTYISNSEYRRR